MTDRIKVHHLDPATGADGQVPMISGGKFVIGTPAGGSGGGGGGKHGAKVIPGTTGMTVPTATNTILTNWSTEKWDTAGYWNPANPSRFTVPPGYDGPHLVVGHFTFDNSAAFDQILGIVLNGTEITTTRVRGGSAFLALGTASVLNLVAGDYVELRVYQGSGSSKIQNNPAALNEFAIQKFDGIASDASAIDGGTPSSTYLDFIDGGTP